MVYVISQEGKPLMPTVRYAKVRILLKSKKAKVVQSKPFTIQLLYQTTSYVQPITLGIDCGYQAIGISAISEQKELLSGEVQLLQGMTERLRDRAMYRRQRRSRLRYRKPRFNNRKIDPGWLAPSIRHKYDSHLRAIKKIKAILPIRKVIIEVANFDIQKIKDPDIESKGYQEGEQKDSYNLREYILHRDHHTCQLCGKTDVPLEVHHLGYWKGDRGNRPSNLITLCVECHVPKNHHKGQVLYGWNPKLKTFREATFMSMVRWRLVNALGCKHTYGYITKSRRIELGLSKSHANDAFCIARGTDQSKAEVIQFRQIKRNNCSLEKFYDAKYIDSRTQAKVSGQELFNGRRTRNKNLVTENRHVYRQQKLSKGKRTIRKKHYFYQPNDIVIYEHQKMTVKGTHCNGQRVLLQNKKSVAVKNLTPYRFCKGLIAS